MIITLLSLLAAPAAGRVITPSERAIIEAAVKPELTSPGTLAIGPVPAAASIVCGRVNGGQFQVVIKRDKAGKIVAAQQAVVLTAASDSFQVMVVDRNCLEQGYHTTF
jgi:hypothetical protein